MWRKVPGELKLFSYCQPVRGSPRSEVFEPLAQEFISWGLRMCFIGNQCRYFEMDQSGRPRTYWLIVSAIEAKQVWIADVMKKRIGNPILLFFACPLHPPALHTRCCPPPLFSSRGCVWCTDVINSTSFMPLSSKEEGDCSYQTLVCLRDASGIGALHSQSE